MRTTPFHERTDAANETGLWSEWAGYRVPRKYRIDEKVEYYAVRNAAGLLDTSPLFKYRIYGSDAEALLATVLARDIRSCRPGRAQYTMWCDDGGFLIEDGVVVRTAPDEFWLTSAEPNLAHLESMIGRRRAAVDDVTERFGIVALQGPASRTILTGLAPAIADLRFFGVASAKLGPTPVMVSRTGYTGDLGYEVWVEADDALAVWDTVTEAGAGRGLLPYGSLAMHMARIEAGLLLIEVDYETSRFAWTDQQRATPVELGYGWMFRRLDRDDRAFLGRGAIERELADGTSRFRLVGVDIDWTDHDRVYREAGLLPAKDHIPVEWELMVYDDKRIVGHASSFMYSPVLQRHIAIARVEPALAAPGTELRVEIAIAHRNQLVAARVRPLPFYDPPHKAA